MNSYLTDFLIPPSSFICASHFFPSTHASTIWKIVMIIKNKARKMFIFKNEWRKRKVDDDKEWEKFLDQQPSKSQMDFYVSFHNLMFQFNTVFFSVSFYHEKESFFNTGRRQRRMITTKSMRKWRKFSSCFSFFYFLMVFHAKSSLESFCWDIYEKIKDIKLIGSMNLIFI